MILTYKLWWRGSNRTDIIFQAVNEYLRVLRYKKLYEWTQSATIENSDSIEKDMLIHLTLCYSRCTTLSSCCWIIIITKIYISTTTITQDVWAFDWINNLFTLRMMWYQYFVYSNVNVRISIRFIYFFYGLVWKTNNEDFQSQNRLVWD